MATTTEVDVNQTLRYLTGAFARATAGMERASRVKDKQTNKFVTNELYDLQVNFCHFINEIERGPKYLVPKTISICNQFIGEIVASRSVQSA